MALASHTLDRLWYGRRDRFVADRLICPQMVQGTSDPQRSQISSNLATFADGLCVGRQIARHVASSQ